MQTDHEPTQRYAIREGVHIADLGDQGMVLLDLARDEYLGADLIGTEIIRHILQNDGSVEGLAVRIARDYHVAADVVHNDVTQFLMRCIAEGIVERVPPDR